MNPRECRDCGELFYPRPGKPGFIDQCESCARDVELLGGNMIWAHKTAPEIEIKPQAEARAFARKTKRFGAGVTASLVSPREAAENVGMKRGTGAEDRAPYVTRLGEKRNVKL